MILLVFRLRGWETPSLFLWFVDRCMSLLFPVSWAAPSLVGFGGNFSLITFAPAFIVLMQVCSQLYGVTQDHARLPENKTLLFKGLDIIQRLKLPGKILSTFPLAFFCPLLFPSPVFGFLLPSHYVLVWCRWECSCQCTKPWSVLCRRHSGTSNLCFSC